MPVDIPIKTETHATYAGDNLGKVKYNNDIIEYIRHEAERLQGSIKAEKEKDG